MMMHELLRLIDGYLVGRHSLQYLETWLLSHLQAILDAGDQAAIELANQADADLVEFAEGLMDEAELRERLESSLRHRETITIIIPLEMKAAPEPNQTAATAETLTQRWQDPGPVVTIHQRAVFA